VALTVTALVFAMLAPGRPAVGSPHHTVGQLPHTALAEDGLVADGWQQRALFRDGTPVVLGPARETPAMPKHAITVDAAAAIETVAASGWPGAQAATLVLTASGTVAWRVDPPAGAQGLANPVFLVDAVTGQMRLRHDRVRHETIGAFVGNPVTTPVATDFELLDYDPVVADGALQGERIAVFNCAPPKEAELCAFEQISPTDARGNFAHPVPDIDNHDDNVQPLDPFAVQSVHHHAESFLAYLDELGFPPLGCVADGDPLVLIANYQAYQGGRAIPIANAAYVGDCGLTAVFGQGAEADFGYDGDVVYHELTHGAVETMMDGGFLGLPRTREEGVVRDAGAVNEGVADFIAAVLTGDPVHAEYVHARGGGTTRTLDNDYSCPASLTGEVHYDGELFGAALWDVYGELQEPFVPAVFDAIALLPEDATFDEASAAVVAVVGEELGEDEALVAQAAFEARGLLDCTPVMAWDALERPLWLRPRGQGGKFDPLQPPPAQLAVALPDEADGFWLRFQTDVLPTPGFEPITEVHVLVGYGAPIEFSYRDGDNDFTIVHAEPDLHLPAIDALAAGEGVWVEAPGGQTTYLALFNQSPNVTRVVEVEVEAGQGAVDPDTGDSGAADESGGAPGDGGSETSSSGARGSGTGDGAAGGDEGGSEGCGCRSNARGTPWAWMVLVVVLLGRRRRRATVSA